MVRRMAVWAKVARCRVGGEENVDSRMLKVVVVGSMARTVRIDVFIGVINCPAGEYMEISS